MRSNNLLTSISRCLRLFNFRRAIAMAVVCSLLIASCKWPSRSGKTPSPKKGAAAVIRGLEAVKDPKQRQLLAAFTLNTMCTLSRLASGQSNGRIETAVSHYFTTAKPEAKAKLRALGDTLKAIPTAKRKELLGTFAAYDPGACTSAPNWDGIRDDIVFSHLLRPRLRTNYCSGNFSYSDGTVADRAITAGFQLVPNVEAPPSVYGAASPVILGVEGDHVKARHPALAATSGAQITDGISPYGVITDIPCSATNDSCPAAQGLICGQKIGGGVADTCIAFPVVQKDEDLVLRGYNFWDTEEARLVFTPLVPGAGTESSTVVSAVNANEPLQSSGACPPASQSNPTHNRASFKVGVNEGNFYKLRLYNHNGTFRTQQDAQDHAEPRPIHVCYPNSLGPADVPADTVRDCTPPTEPCVQDGARCAATWTNPPRKLQDCHHLLGNPVRCGETPEWFPNEALTRREDNAGAIKDPVVFVIKDEPKYEFRATLQAIECKDESGWDWTGSDEPMLMIVGMPSEIPEATETELLEKIDKYTGTFRGGDYDTGDRKMEVKRLSTVGDLTADDQVEYVIALYEDDSFYASFFAGAVVIVAVTAIIALSAGSIATVLAAVGGGATATFIWKEMVKAMSEDDPMGRTSVLANVTLMNERIAAGHANNLLSAGPAFGALPLFPGETADGEKSAGIIHPFVDFRLGKPLEVECMPGSCGSGEICVVNRCMPVSFVDETAGRGFRERREFKKSGTHYAIDILWEKVPMP